MQLIKIKRSSIKKNPDAGRTEFSMPGDTTVSGTYQGQVPSWIEKHVTVHSWRAENDKITECDFFFHGPVDHDTIERLAKDKKATVEVTHNRIITYCATPEPDYLYKYENPLLKCSECNKKVRFADIESGYMIDEDGDEHNADQCPHCGSLNSFDYTLEKITDVVK